MATRYPSSEEPGQTEASASQRPTFTHTRTEEHVKKSLNLNGEEANMPSLNKTNHDDASSHQSTIEQDVGVTKIEALYLVFSGWKIWILWGSIALIANIYALQGSTTGTYLSFATSAFKSHALLGTIQVVTSIMTAVMRPFEAKIADLISRPAALAMSVMFYCLGYIAVAASKNVTDVAAGEVLYTIGTTGITAIMAILLADITSLQWRGLASGLYSAPYIYTAFIAGSITQGINAYSENGWRWGFGMFIIMVPILMAPAIGVLFWADWKAKKIGALSLASSSYARRHALGQEDGPKKSFTQMFVYYCEMIDVLGLLLMGFAWAMLLLPFTLYASAKNHWKNPSLIAMFVVGGILMICFTIWELKYAKHPIMPRRILNRSLICSCVIDFSYYLSGYIHSTYYLSWVYVVVDWSAKDYNYFSNITTVGLCLFGVVAGLIQRYTHRYKYLQVTGLCLRIIGQAIVYVQTRHIHRSDALMVMGPVIISMGGACSVVGSQVAAQGSVPHQDMALAMALLALWTRIGGAIGGAISAAIWTDQLPKHLQANLGQYLNATQINNIYGSIKVARAQTQHRELIIRSYLDTAWYLEVPTLVLCIVPLIAGLLTSNFFLGENHNSIEDKKVIIHRDASAVDEEILREKAKQVEERVKMEVGRL
ncbi:uncharacterized protein I303_106544 [Kwoniella dejecticola CBS 10117]|uniref:Major facilitator superfamily (MFS) profile domain-containing protein n=1 Tax=Kwoniella dejecticola CBS 10117 TaxID=1296121 RepID=A0A1A5ZUD9_9TREE|nr:uncharacterized protein I303_08199 [Kwoniella dejecticola CBS 10117]OBR81429.1 hypothetical protein I303_08199 [Kwoniella dejecticola CBS 10117]